MICSGDSNQQLEAIRNGVGEVLKKAGVRPHHCEGTVDSGWLLMDFNDVIVHIFTPVERANYQLDRLFSKATPVIRIQ